MISIYMVLDKNEFYRNQEPTMMEVFDSIQEAELFCDEFDKNWNYIIQKMDVPIIVVD